MRLLLLALLAVAAIASGCSSTSSGSSSGASEEEVPYVSPSGYDENDLATFREALGMWNASGSWRIGSLARSGDTRCVLGFDAVFPELVLVTVLSTSGRWFQVSIHPDEGVRGETVKSGSDYNLALSGQSAEEFIAAGESCNVDSDGTVTLTNG